MEFTLTNICGVLFFLFIFWLFVKYCCKKYVLYKDSLDFTAWEMTDYVGNIFNRAIVYQGNYFHAAVQYFGHSDDYCRMHQTFFFSTEELGEAE